MALAQGSKTSLKMLVSLVNNKKQGRGTTVDQLFASQSLPAAIAGVRTAYPASRQNAKLNAFACCCYYITRTSSLSSGSAHKLGRNTSQNFGMHQNLKSRLRKGNVKGRPEATPGSSSLGRGLGERLPRREKDAQTEAMRTWEVGEYW